MKVLSTSLERRFKGCVPSYAKKSVVNFLCAPVFGKVIKLLRLRFNLFGGYFDYSVVQDFEAAYIFWGFWESAEIRFAKRFIDCNTIIELGSSVGVTLGVLANQYQNKRFICIEASKPNFNKLEKLVTQLPSSNEYVLINKAISYGAEKVSFLHTTTTGSKICYTACEDKCYVKATTLSDVLIEHDVTDNFCLISDIEGAESSIFFEDESSLNNCEKIVAELENTDNYTIEQQLAKLLSFGFSLVERYGNVVVVTK